MLKIIVITFSIVCCISCGSKKDHNASRQAIKDSLTAELDSIQRLGYCNGFSAAIVSDTGILYQEGIGYADIEVKKKYTTATIQNIASISKTFIGVALLKAQELGKLQLDDPINKYLPFKVVNPRYPAVPITLRQLATHTSSIADNEFYEKKSYVLKPGQDVSKMSLQFEDAQAFIPADSAVSVKDFFQNVLLKEGKWFRPSAFLDKRPGNTFEYSNVGAALAAFVLECATGEPFNEFTRKYILQPLKMNASGWKFSEVNFNNYSKLYSEPGSVLPFYSNVTYPDGGFITSISDMGNYLSELMKGYRGHGTILSERSYAELFRQQLSAANFTGRNMQNPYDDEYNTGIFMGFSFAGNIGHTGGDPGVVSMMFFNPTTRIGRLLILNTSFNNKGGNDAFYAIWDKLEKYQERLRDRL
jgi:CubicO group peptidase (beta-lactamase class C family)